MINHRRIFIFLFIVLIAGPFTAAQDGMWMPHQMKDLNLKALGLEMNPENLFKEDGTGLMSAVVSLGGGSGEFVSRDGLILTNHHVAFGALQRASSKDNDYITNGFTAWERGEEIPASGYIADVLQGYEDVTAAVTAALKKAKTPIERYYARDAVMKKIVAEAEKAGPDIRASVASMYSGNTYYLFRFKRLKDIRIVLAPPQDLGNYGGDIDNWMWPRHTCDFSFLRAYVSPDNTGADFSQDNVPYKPKSVLAISLAGLKEGDFSFVMGYPGRTYRNYSLSELRYDMDFLKSRMTMYQDIIRFLDKASEGDRAIAIKYASNIKGLNNGLKNYQGKLEGMQKISLLERKKRMEEDLIKWVSQDQDRMNKFSGMTEGLGAHMKKFRQFSQSNNTISGLTSSRFGSSLLAQAYSIVRTAMERQKPDMERESAYQERNLSYIRQRIELAERSYEIQTDRAFLKFRLKAIRTEEGALAPEALKSLQTEEDIEAFVDRLFDGTVIQDPQVRLKLIDKTPSELKAMKDPMLDLAFALEEELKTLREESKALGQERADLKKTYVRALLDRNEGRLAPDANSTIRFTYGTIQGYTPRDAVEYGPFTTLGGVLEKETGTFPFKVPEKLKELYGNKDFGRYADPGHKDIPACFLNTASVTGGSSGSPTFNARGEQTGIIFDMTYESVTSDYHIISELQRTISVDIRYVLFVTEKFSGAVHILDELILK
jgi:hypothetical protein